MGNGRGNDGNAAAALLPVPPAVANKAVISGLPELEDTVLRLQEAAMTLKLVRLSGVRPAGLKAAWPDYVQNAFEAFNIDAPEKPTMRPAIPGPELISRMDEALAWLFMVEPWEGSLVLARAYGGRWRRLEKTFGKSERWLRDAYWAALIKISQGRKK